MNQKLLNFSRSTKKYLVKHSPEIFTGIGIAGMFSSIVLAVKATPKAIELIKKEKNERFIEKFGCSLTALCDENDIKLSKLDIIKIAWKPYIPVLTTALISSVLIIEGNRINSKRNAALMTAYALSERTLLSYRDKVIETVGEKKEKEIRDKISQDEIKNKPLNNSQVIITQKGETLFLDTISGRYFKSDIEKIKRIVNELNRKMNYENYISLNDFYYELGLDTIINGADMGWNISTGLIDLYFSACLTENEEPCIVINYMTSPKYGYDSLL